MGQRAPARLWRRYKGPIKKDGPSVELEVYSFLTTTPNPLVETFNHERMPVLLTTEDQFATWLNGTPTEVYNPKSVLALINGPRPNLLRDPARMAPTPSSR